MHEGWYSDPHGRDTPVVIFGHSNDSQYMSAGDAPHIKAMGVSRDRCYNSSAGALSVE
jgi:uracil-DNA glycosylase